MKKISPYVKVWILFVLVNLHLVSTVQALTSEPNHDVQTLASNAEDLDRAKFGLPVVQYTVSLAKDSNAEVALGKMLFFDRRLSVNNTLSCALCHLPGQAFTSNDVKTSVGMEGASGRRNAPSLWNVAYVRALFHDGRAKTLEQQALMPLVQADEMANPSVRSVIERIAKLPDYQQAWQQAYGPSARPSKQQLGHALSAYQRTLVSGNSRFDKWHYGKDESALSQEEKRGFSVFLEQGCARCHTVEDASALFSDHRYYNIGTYARSVSELRKHVIADMAGGLQVTISPQEIARISVGLAKDDGRYEVTKKVADLRAFRTPSLRNVELTAPYMHDGSFETLEQVVDYYIQGGWPQDKAQSPIILPLKLVQADRAALVAFLKTLSGERALAESQNYR